MGNSPVVAFKQKDMEEAAPSHNMALIPPADWMYFDNLPCADAEINSSIRSKFDLPVPFCPITTFKSPGRQVTSLSDLKPLTSSCLIFIWRSPFNAGIG